MSDTECDPDYDKDYHRMETLEQQLTVMTEQYITERTANAKAHQEIARLRSMEAETWAKAAELVEWQANGIWFDHVREAYQRAAKLLRQQARGTKEGAGAVPPPVS